MQLPEILQPIIFTAGIALCVASSLFINVSVHTSKVHTMTKGDRINE